MRQSILVRSLATAVGGAAITLLSACSESHSQEADAEGPAPQVSVVTLKHQEVTLTRELPGRAHAFLMAEVRPQVGGIVKRRLFTEGGMVAAGQALYELDDASYRAAFDSAQANLRKAQAMQHAAQLAAERSRELVKTHVISAQDHEAAIAGESEAQADVGVAQAAVDSARLDLGRARIVAPIAGRIGKSNVTEGALVTANQPEALALIQQLDPMYVEVNQPSNHWLTLKQAIDAGRVRSDDKGAPVKILLENGTAYGHDGKLQFADVTVDTATGNVLLRAIVPNPNSLLLPGMYVRAVVSEGVSPDAVLAPQQGITRDPKGNANALIVGADGKVDQREVQVSRAIGDQWLVEGGLAAGDRVIVEGVQKVGPGTVVDATEHAAAEPGVDAGAGL